MHKTNLVAAAEVCDHNHKRIQIDRCVNDSANCGLQKGSIYCATCLGREYGTDIIYVEKCDLLAENENGNTVSSLACYKTESLDIIKELLERGASVHTINNYNENLTALWYARWSNNNDIVNELLKAGAKNIVPSALDAVLLNDIDALIEAIDKSCDLNETDSSGDTALHNAVQMGYNEMLILLLDAGCSVNIQNSCGDTALHLACVPGTSSEIIEMLVRADKDIVDM
ncbi:uncharacterized protein LOC113367405 [Ctenocephalides felis]|uniref:uncharacterized protein LOC113367405 n=1 Tax=Ctenocephalides felis TaxID=7515 RepID=UPI000E6E317C|nr:uncharacterized protein LOC113367405 [Ctenocephalides felis]